MNEHRWLILLVTLVIGANLLVGGYLLSTYAGSRTATIGQTIADTLTSPRPLHLTQLTRERADFPALTPQNTIRYLSIERNALIEVRADGTGETTLAAIAEPVRDLLWSPDRTAAIIATSSPGGTVWRTLDLRSQTWTVLPGTISAAVFSPRGDKIAYLREGSPEGSLTVVFVGTSTPKSILTTRITRAVLTWPKEELLSFVVEGSDGLRSWYTIDLNGKLTKLADARPQLEVRWSPDGARALLSWFDESGLLQTSTVTLLTHDEQKMELATLASKCAWGSSGSTLVCGIPQSPVSPQGYGRATVHDAISVFEVGEQGVSPREVPLDRALSVSAIDVRSESATILNALDDFLWILSLR